MRYLQLEKGYFSEREQFNRKRMLMKKSEQVEGTVHTPEGVKGAGNSKLWAMLACKCPICTKGNMFKSPATDFRNFNELRESCAVCGYKFMPEPGFYQVSLFFTYAVGVAIFVVFGFIAYWIFNNPPLWVYYVAIITPAVLTVPWNLRYSKVMMLYAFGNVWDKRHEEG